MTKRATKHVMATSFNDFGLLKTDSEVAVISMPLALSGTFVDQLDIEKTRARWMGVSEDMPADDDYFYRRAPSRPFNFSAQTTPEQCSSWITMQFGGGHTVNPHAPNPAHRVPRDPPGLDKFSAVLGPALHEVHKALGYKHYNQGRFEAKCALPPEKSRALAMRYHNVDTAIIVNVSGASTEFCLNPATDLYDKCAGEVPGAVRLEGPHISVHRYGTWHAATLPEPQGRLIYISGGSVMEMPGDKPASGGAGRLLRQFLNRSPSKAF